MIASKVTPPVKEEGANVDGAEEAEGATVSSNAKQHSV